MDGERGLVMARKRAIAHKVTRKISHIAGLGGSEVTTLEPDPDAPSLSEVVEELRLARNEYDASLGNANRPTEGEIPDRINRLDDLIARLEGE